LHLVGHSLGGVIIVKLFELAPVLPPGRIVLLGSPLLGCRAANNLARLPLGRRALGLSIHEEVLHVRERKWRVERPLGILAGESAFGLGRLLGPLGGPSDGTVLIAETRLPGASEHRVLRVSHSGLVFSAAVARQTAAFLRTGRFEP
jgi:pimeloyl-ACP methyl ester carboxylesterase